MSPYADRKGHNYLCTDGDWNIELEDAVLDPVNHNIEVFNEGKIRVSGPDKSRIEGMTFARFKEEGNVYLFGETNNGKFAKDAGKVEGNDNYTNVSWTPAFTHSIWKLTCFVQGRHRTDKGKMTIAGDIIVSYTNSDSYVGKKYAYAFFERDTINVTINQNVVTEPTLAVYDTPFLEEDSHDITDKFNFLYRIEGEPFKDINYDTNTQSSVFSQTGEVRTGGKMGSFKVLVMPIPKDEETSRLYLPDEASYVVNVHGRKGVVSMNGHLADDANPTQLKLYKNIPVKTPIYKVMDPTGKIDLSQYYKMSLNDVQLKMLDGNQNIVESVNNGANIKGVIEGKSKARMTFLPKDEYVTLYDAASITIETTVLSTPLDAGARVVLSSTELEGDDTLKFKRNNQYFSELVVKVYDDLGNDVSEYYDFDPQKVSYTLNTPQTTNMYIKVMDKKQADYNNDKYKDDPNYVPAKAGDPMFYTGSRSGTETMTVSIPRKSTSSSVFKNVTKQVTIIVGSNYPDIVVNPKKITLRVGQTWSASRGSRYYRVSNIDVKAYQDLRSNNDEYNSYYYNVIDNTSSDQLVTQGTGNYSSARTHKGEVPDWSVTAGTMVGTYNLQIVVRPSDRTSFDEVTVNWPVEVVAKIKPVAAFTADKIVVRHGQKVIEPILKITDANGEDISDQYTVRYTAILDNRYYGTKYIFQNVTGTGQYAYSTDGKINTGLLDNYDGTYTIKATLVPKNATDYEEGSATYDLLVYQAKWGYKIEKDAHDTTYGRLDFTSPGDMLAGSIIDGVPGLAVQFGAVGADDWDVRSNSDGTDIYATSSEEAITLDPGKTIQATVATVKDDKTVFAVQEIPYLPTRGSFIKLVPAADGFVQADMEWQAGHTYVLIRYRDEKIERFTYTPTETKREIHRFMNAVYGGYPAYFYDSTDGGHMKVYGFNFIPAYILTPQDEKATAEAVAYLNWAKNEQGKEEKLMKKLGLPWFVHEASPYVTQYVEDSYKQYADISSDLGIFDLQQTTDGVAQGAHASTKVPAHEAATREDGVDGTSTVPEMHIRVYGKVISAEDPSIYRLAWYDMMIAGIPSYQVPEDYTPSVQQKVTSVPGITMTWGGWRRFDNIDYKYNKNGESYDIQDAWNKSLNDEIAADNGTLEGYLYSSAMGGQSNAKDELANVYKAGGLNFDTNGGTPVSDPYTLPCRGDYVTFKPTKAGTLYVYVLQKGCVEWNGNDQLNPGKNDMIRWRPLYILDERDCGVALKKTLSTEDYSSLMKTGNGYLTRSKFLCSPYTAADYSGGKGRGYDRETNTAKEITNFKYLVQFKDGMTQSRLDFLKAHWGNYGEQQTVLDMDDMDEYKNSGRKTGGHLLISKGYVRYTFDVLPGKTYFLFQTGSKMGLAGFAFDAQADKEAKSVTLESSTTQSFLNSDEQQTRHANVTLTGKKLIKNQWNSITLPFSMNEEQVEQTFGTGSKITVFSDVNENASTNGRIYFTEHRYQHIVAGQPCMLWPTFTDADGNALAGISLKHDDKHSMDYVDNITIPDVAIDREMNTLRELKSKTTPGYTMQGLYEVSADKEINVGDYYMSWGTLTYSNYGNQSGTFNAILRGKTESSPAKMSATHEDFLGNILDDYMPMGIDGITVGPKSFVHAQGVYNLQGQRMGDTTTDLPAGVYIVNGKKIIIR